MQSPLFFFLIDGKKGVGIVSVSIPSEGCNSLQKKNEKKLELIQAKRIIVTPCLRYFSPWCRAEPRDLKRLQHARACGVCSLLSRLQSPSPFSPPRWSRDQGQLASLHHRCSIASSPCLSHLLCQIQSLLVHPSFASSDHPPLRRSQQSTSTAACPLQQLQTQDLERPQ